MDPITLALILGGVVALSKSSGKTDSGDFVTVSNPDITIPKKGEPSLKVDKVHKLLNRVDFTFCDGQSCESFKHKWKGKEITEAKVGKYIVQAITGMEPDKKGNFDFGPVMITVKEPGKGVKFAKRVLVNDKKVIDIK